KRPVTISRPDDTLGNLPGLFQRLEVRQAATARSFQKGKPASQAAVVSSFIVQQDGETPLLNGRPFKHTGLPVQLYHPVFDTFTNALDTSEELGNSRYAQVETLLHACQEIYPDEKIRRVKIEPYFCQILSSRIDEHRVPKCQADGAITYSEQYGFLKAYCAILEVKNEVGTGQSDPSIQGGESYGIYWSQDEMSQLRQVCRCPSLIIALAGPWMCILGAIYLEDVVVQPLTDYIWLGHHPQQDRRLIELTRVFHALDTSVSELKKYYENLFKSLALLRTKSTSIDPDAMRFFPYFRSFRGEDLREVRFNYLHILGDPSLRRSVFKASAETGEDIVVKFAERYGIDVHRLLASRGLAPKVLFYESPRSRAGLHTIVMEYVPSTHPHDNQGKGHLDYVKNDVRKALDLLHENNFAFGDLRTPNILIMERASGVYGGMLVDFDWCGKEGKVRYPAGMVLEDRVSTAEKGGLILKEHDWAMFDMVFE
ncbi:hypothetical protein FRC11_014955, partial [Ceratobasidium sp. 423]